MALRPIIVRTLKIFVGISSVAGLAIAQSDPGPRGGAPGAGGQIAGLTVKEAKFFDSGRGAFTEVDAVAKGLGPRFNLDSCGGCHAAPAVGGSSPATNPQVALAPSASQLANVSAFITASGPVREVRFKSDGRTGDLLQAIEAHASGGADTTSEAVQVVNNFNGLTTAQKQDVLNFLRSL
jgi:CxxC motif-containing protein (DUF1111 family)